MKRFSASTLFFVFSMALMTQAADLPVSILQSRPDKAPTLSIPAFSKIDAALREKGTVRVIVRTVAPADGGIAFALEHTLQSTAAVNSQRAVLSRTQDTVLSRISRPHAAAAKRFHFIPYMALEVDQTEFLALASSPEIDFIEEDIPVLPTLEQSVPLIGGVDGAFNGYTGNGQTVAILDTGVDKTHPFLNGKVVAEACYSTTSPAYSSTAVCTDGSTAPGSGLNCDSALEGCEHGTHVAGISAGKGSTFSGVAKDADIIAIQVFSSFPASECGGSPCVMSWSSDQVAGLQHVYDLRNTFNISSANMSLGGGAFTTFCDGEYSSETAAIDALRSVGIATAIASGNEGTTSSISFPACISSAVSVGATTKSDLVDERYSNSASILSLLAPGSAILSSVPGGGFDSWYGTSMATPHVAGAWAVLKSVRPKASVSKILNALTITGVPITDTRNSIVKPRIQLDKASQILKADIHRTDFDGDDKADVAIWRPAEGKWYIIDSSTNAQKGVQWGAIGDIPVPADYDGDGISDLAVWRQSDGKWYIMNSSTDNQVGISWGNSSDIPVSADYDGDGKADIAVWRPVEGRWYIIDSSTNNQRSIVWGVSSDIPVPADYDGDGKADIAVWRPVEGKWYIIDSSTNTQRGIIWGASGDTPVPADFDFDGKTDIAVWRPVEGKWYIIDSSTNTQRGITWGASGDTPVPADFDGDGKTDIAVWRAAEGKWYIIDSSSNMQRGVRWGVATDQPIR